MFVASNLFLNYHSHTQRTSVLPKDKIILAKRIKKTSNTNWYENRFILGENTFKTVKYMLDWILYVLLSEKFKTI